QHGDRLPALRAKTSLRSAGFSPLQLTKARCVKKFLNLPAVEWRSGVNAAFRLFKHVEFAFGLAQLAGEVETKLFQQFDFERRMRLPKPLEIFERKQMTFDIRVGNDVRGARRAVNERHLAKRHARRKRGEAVPFLAGQEHADISSGEEKNFPGVVAGVDDALSALERARLQQRLDGLQFRAGKFLEQQVVRRLRFGA